jgi:hypothetical protein
VEINAIKNFFCSARDQTQHLGHGKHSTTEPQHLTIISLIVNVEIFNPSWPFKQISKEFARK